MQKQWATAIASTEGETALKTTHETLRALERCWSDAVRYADEQRPL